MFMMSSALYTTDPISYWLTFSKWYKVHRERYRDNGNESGVQIVQ